MITRQQIADHVTDLKREISQWQSLKGTALIVAEDGDLITVQHQSRDIGWHDITGVGKHACN